VHNLPEKGQATLLCFNHGNSLGDAIVLMATCPHVIRFCAKCTLWDIPFVGTLIRMSAAVPVYRRQEHGENAMGFNKDMFAKVYSSLGNGDWIGFSPEGMCNFQPHPEKFKDGVGHIALETVDRAVKNGNSDFKINIAPTVLLWTHRERFRSDALVRFLPKIQIGKEWLEIPDRKLAAKQIVQLLETTFHDNILNATSWDVIRRAITAARIHRPMGTAMSLSTYMYLLKGWTTILEVGSHDALNKALEDYQSLLDAAKLKDQRILRMENDSTKRPSVFRCVNIIIYRVFLSCCMLVVITPGLLLWIPMWYFLRKKEKELLIKGIGWVDSIAETKMMFSFLFVVFLLVALNVYAIPLLIYLWIVLRLYEEFMSSTRSTIGVYRLLLIDQQQLNVLVRERSRVRDLVIQATKDFPRTIATSILDESHDNIYSDKTSILAVVPRWWTNFNPLRRRKKDWNELLWFRDMCTMDYQKNDW